MCRDALILAAEGSREELIASCEPVLEAWAASGDTAAAMATLQGVTRFSLHLDTLKATPSPHDTATAMLDPEEFSSRPEVRAVVARLSEDTLDRIASLWFRAKGEPVPPPLTPSGPKIPLDDWSRGDLVDWFGVRELLRAELYLVGDALYAFNELHCIEPNCTCARTKLRFYNAPYGENVGEVVLDGANWTLVPERPDTAVLLTELWDAFLARHAPFEAHLASRNAVMHGLSARFVSKSAIAKLGRNDPCYCGSEKKFKKCCAP